MVNLNTFKRNYLIYFYAYFIAQVIYIYLNVYLPIYFFNVLNVNRIQLAFVQIFSYSALFLKPIFAVYLDKEQFKRKRIIILSAFGIIISFIFFILNANLLVIFGIFLGINFAFISLMDVAIDKIVIENSTSEKIKDNNILCTQLGSISGAVLPNLIFLMIITDEYSLAIWNQFFLIGIISIIPLLFIVFLLKDVNIEKKKVEKLEENPVKIISIVLMCLFIFLIYADKLYEYPLEPWALNALGMENIGLFSILMIIFIILNIIGIIFAGIFSKKYDRKKIIIISSIASGVLLIIAPFTNIFIFFILVGIIQILAGFLLINMISMIIDLSQKKVLYFQVMASFKALASVIFVPMGTLLSASIATELIIAAAGALIILSAIPMYFLEEKEKEI